MGSSRVGGSMIVAAGAVIAGMACSAAIAQEPQHFFDTPWIGYDTGPWPEAVYPYDAAVGDFNGDGTPDLATVSFLVGWPTLSILMGDGYGGYLPPVNHETLLESGGIVAFDWDNDGDLDLATTDTDRFYGGFSVSIWENGGSGDFALLSSFSVNETGPHGITAADFDGDGWVDLATANDGDIDCNNTVSVLLNAGGFGFHTPVVYTLSSCTAEIDSGDVNGDGHIDLVIGHRANRWTLMLNNQEGAFSVASVNTGIPAGSLPDNPAIHLADIDLDTDLDVFYSNANSGGIDAGAIGLWRNNGDGTFAAAETMSFDWETGGGVDIISGDVTEDGWPDVFAAAGEWFLFESDGAGGFEPAKRFRAGHSANSVRLSDLDTDGDLDVTIVAPYSIEACVYLNPGDGAFVQPGVIDFCDPALSPAFTTNIESGDVDGDGDLDLVVGFRSDFNSSHGLTIRRNNGDGTFGPRETYAEPVYPAWVKLADMDGDGDLDLLTLDGSARFSIRRNNGSGGFSQRITGHQFSFQADNMQVDAVDVDHDGDLDVCANTGFFFRVSRNLGNGSFGTPYVAVDLNMQDAQSFAFGDMNEDGFIDLLTGSGATNARVLLCLGNGNGTFQSPINIGVAERDIHSIATADLDNDGHLDLTAINDRTPKQISIRRGRGDGNFHLLEAHSMSFFFNQYTPGGTTELIDVTGDGFKDILFANTYAQDFSLWRNNGDGSFQEKVRYGAGHDVYDMTAGDFNGDGLIDVAMSAQVDDGRWFYSGVVLIMGRDPKPGGGTVAPLVDFSIVFGSHVGGGLAELEASDDAYLRARSQFGFSAAEPNIVDLVTGFESPLASPAALDFTLESRLNNPGGNARVRIKNFKTRAYEQIGTFSTAQEDATNAIEDIDPSMRVRASDGRVEVSTRVSVIATFSAAGFDAWFDHAGLGVR